jgi:hypothetical protein
MLLAGQGFLRGGKVMKRSTWLLAGLAGLAVAGGLAGLGATVAAPAPMLSQINPEPPNCACSPGVDLGSPKAPVILRHCMCGQLQCAVLPAAGQLQCSR